MGTATLVYPSCKVNVHQRNSLSTSDFQLSSRESHSQTFISPSASSPSQSRIHPFFPGSTFYNFESLRILSTAPAGGCDPAEFLVAIASIQKNDPISWGQAWTHAASLAESIAEEAFTRGDTVGARDAFLRASNYWRASGYMLINGPTLDKHDPRALPTMRKVQALFRRAIPYMECDARVVEIPYVDDTQLHDEPREVFLPGYLYLPVPQHRLPDGKIPVLLNVGGADSVQEELYYIHPQAGYVRGYAVLTFEGPGQGIVLRETGLHMRPDWEVVTGRVLDWLERYAEALKQEGIELDLERIAVAGASMGGYYALRAASDRRIRACVAVDPHGARVRGSGAVVMAAEEGKLDMVTLLLDKGADIDEIGIEHPTDPRFREDMGSALHRAVVGGHEAVVKFLVDKGADVNLKDVMGRTPLALAHAGGNSAIVELLRERGALE